MFWPIFEKDNINFIIAGMTGNTEEEAWQTGIGVTLVEGVAYGFRFTNQVAAENTTIEAKGTLGPFTVGVL